MASAEDSRAERNETKEGDSNTREERRKVLRVAKTQKAVREYVEVPKGKLSQCDK